MIEPGAKQFRAAPTCAGLNNLLVAYADKSAQAVCTFAYSKGPRHDPIIFQGRTDVREPLSLLGTEELTYSRYSVGEDSSS